MSTYTTLRDLYKLVYETAEPAPPTLDRVAQDLRTAVYCLCYHPGDLSIVERILAQALADVRAIKG